MKKNKSEVIIVLDRSGSMESIKTDVEGGYKTFIDKQKQEPGECFVSLYQFDTEHETVFENKNIQDVGPLRLSPRGGTALFDAIGRTIDAVGQRLKNTPEEERPETVIVTILTDGEENSSKRFTTVKIRDMIEHQNTKYNWAFVFVGANQDAVLAGTSYGFNAGTSLSFASNSASVANTYAVLSTGVACMRGLAHEGVAVSCYYFSDDQRAHAMGGPAA